MLGVAGGLIPLVILVTRCIHEGIDWVNGFPWYASLGHRHGPGRQGLGYVGYGFSFNGLISLMVLWGSCGVSLLSRSDRRLMHCLFWISVMITIWSCLQLPAYRPTAIGGLERTGNTLILFSCLSMLLVFFLYTYPALVGSYSAVGIGLVWLLGYHLAVPTAVGAMGIRWGLPAVAAAGLAAGWPCLRRGYEQKALILTDCGMLLVGLALVAAMTAAFPAEAVPLAYGYPSTFTAMMVGAGAAGWLGAALVLRCRRRIECHSLSPYEWLRPAARRAAFFLLALACLSAANLAVWPRLTGIRAADDSLQRVTAGLGANLFLVLITLWAARRLRGLPFQILALAAVFCTLGFLLARMLPFTPRYG